MPSASGHPKSNGIFRTKWLRPCADCVLGKPGRGLRFWPPRAPASPLFDDFADLCLVGVVFAVMSRYAVEIFDGRTLHQPASVSLDQEENIDNSIYVPLLFTIAGFMLSFVALLLAQTRTEIRRRRARALAMQAARH